MLKLSQVRQSFDCQACCVGQALIDQVNRRQSAEEKRQRYDEVDCANPQIIVAGPVAGDAIFPV